MTYKVFLPFRPGGKDMAEMVRIRLDLPEKLYHEAKAVVQWLRAQKSPYASSLSSLIAQILGEWIDKHVTFRVTESNARPEIKDVEVR
jgi:hypothetical protein